MMFLIGLGLWDESDLSLRGIEEAKNADEVYIELYTSKWHGEIKNLEKLIGKKVKILERRELEQESDKVLDNAKDKKTVLFVLGDPLVATTHTSLLTEAKKRNIKFQIIHNASIYSAITETGLHIYKFGQTVTVPFSEKSEDIQSVFDKIESNVSVGLHTLCLLDLDSSKNKYMTPNDALKILTKNNKISAETKIVVFGRAGSNSPLFVYNKIKNLIDRNFGEPPFVIIIPGKLHFTEEEFLDATAEK